MSDSEAIETLDSFLENLERIGRFAYGCQKKQLAGPDLDVLGVGPVSMPMQPDLSDLLQKLCQGTEQTLRNDQGEVWHLDAAQLAATNPGWDDVVNSVAAESCEALGLITTAHMQPWLQHVSLVSDKRSYSFDPKAGIPPGTFATMVVLLLPPGMEFQATVQQDSKQELLCISGCEGPCLGCIAYFTGCELSLQSCGDNGYTAMTYHLVQASDTPVVIKDQAWYLSQLQAVMQAHFSCGESRAFYLFEHRYIMEDLDNIQNLKSTHRKMAQMLQAAEHAGVLDVHLAVVTHQECCSYEATLYGSYEDSGVHDCATYVGNWRTLDGVSPGWKAECVNPYGQDKILQGREWLARLNTDSEEEYGGCRSIVNVTKIRSRVGFVIWPRRHRWHFFCQQGPKAATDKLALMLKAIGPLAVPATLVPASDQPGGQVTQETQELMAEAKRLVAAMYSNFKDELNRLSIAGFETFGDVALALDMHWVYFKLIEANLAGAHLKLSTAHQLMSASRHVGWSKLEPALGKIVINTFHSYERPCLDSRFAEAAEAANCLESQDATVGPPLAVLVSTLADLARSVRYLASNGTFSNVHGYGKFHFSTTPSQYPRQGSRAATCCRLVVASLRLMLTLHARTHKNEQLFNVVETVSDILVDAFLQHPQYFYATEVLGPACLQAADGLDFLGSVTESPAFLKLLAGCLYQLRRSLQLLTPCDMPKRCACADCQLVQSFLTQTEQETMPAHFSKAQAHHVMQQLQHQADSQGHLWMAQNRDSFCTLTCGKETQSDKLLRLQQARSLLPRVQAVVNQAVVTLFLKSGQPPAQHCAPVQQAEIEQQPKPEITKRYKLWRQMPMCMTP